LVRVLLWLAVAVGALGVISVLVLLAVGGDTRTQLRDNLRGKVLDMSGGGLGFNDGVQVWQQTEPFRATLAELPNLDDRRRGASYRGGFFTVRMSLYGRTLRELLAECLSLRADRVLGDDALDQRWFDVDAARAQSGVAEGLSGWEPVYESVLAVLTESYGLTVDRQEQEVEVAVLSAGPGWSDHVHDDRRRRGSTTTTGDGVLTLKRGSVRRMVQALEQQLGVLETEGLDADALCDVEMHWPPGDRDALLSVLAEQFDLHLADEQRTVEVAVVSGVPNTFCSGEDPGPPVSEDAQG